MSLIQSGKLWPVGVALAITAVAGFCVWTVKVTSSADIEESTLYMTNYQDADAKANELIKARIAFDKHYNVSYIKHPLSESGTELEYKVTDKEGNAVSDAKITLLITRPHSHLNDTESSSYDQKDGIYKIKSVAFKDAGVYNLIAKIEIGKYSRFYNIKVDTRYPDVAHEY